LVAIVGSYSSIQGLLLWPTGLVLLYHRRRPPWAFISWVAVGVATSALYFYNYHVRSVSALYAVRHPVLSSKLFLFALGDVVGLQTPSGRISLALFSGGGHAINTPGNTVVLLFGAVIFVLAVFVLIRWGLRRDPLGGTPIGIAMIVFGLLFSLFITDGRVLFGYSGVSTSRYTTYDVLVLVGIYLTALSRVPSPRPERINRRAVAGVALAVMAIQVVFGSHYGIAGARSQQRSDLRAVTLTQNIDHESPLTVYSLDIGESPRMIKDDVAFMREHHLSLYG
jgi:hypothetical protein